MAKIKITADIILSIILQIMNDEDINYKITDKSAPSEWQNKKVQEVLNVEYYTYRHRPFDTETIIKGLLQQGMLPNSLYALTRAFCILSLTNIERVYSKHNDTVSVSANLEYWVQSDKVKLIEDMFDDIAVATNGIRIPVQIGTEFRQAVIALGALNISEIDEHTEFGEMAVCDINVDIVFYQNAISKADYKVEGLVGDKWIEIPFSSLSLSSSMNQKAVPRINNVSQVGNINLSRVKSIVLTFDGYINDFITYITDMSLKSDTTSGDTDNNLAVMLKVTRGDDVYIYDCVIKDHLVQVQDNINNETQSLTLTTRGIINGTTQS